jgi:hypothetical protein
MSSKESGDRSTLLGIPEKAKESLLQIGAPGLQVRAGSRGYIECLGADSGDTALDSGDIVLNYRFRLGRMQVGDTIPNYRCAGEFMGWQRHEAWRARDGERNCVWYPLNSPKEPVAPRFSGTLVRFTSE